MTPIKALIIDDEIDICVLLTGLLKPLGIKATFSVTLGDGKRVLSENEFQLLFLDNNLPDGSGLESLAQLIHEYPGLKIIMISAHDGDKERAVAREQGAVDFIGKPLTGDAIRKTLKNHFELLNL